MNFEWYEVVSGPGLEQGDYFTQFPIYRVESSPAGEEADVIEELLDVVVLTQTCDLIHAKVTDVLLAAVTSYDTLWRREGANNAAVRGSIFRKAAVEGNLPPYHLLALREDSPSMPWSLVDFHHLFSVPKTLVISKAEQQGERLRLLPPYKEHLAQAFARYMMRVAVPIPATDFRTYSPTTPRT